MQFPILDELDVYGWDLRKVLKLLYKSNVTPFEWIQSPIVYLEGKGFIDSFKSLLPDFYCARNHAHHYMGLVKGRLEQLKEDKMRLKSFFYILRSLLSAKWSLTFDHYAPMELDPLLELLPKELIDKVYELKTIKSEVDESYCFGLDPHFKLYFTNEYHEMCEKANNVPKKKNSIEKLDEYFLKTLS